MNRRGGVVESGGFPILVAVVATGGPDRCSKFKLATGNCSRSFFHFVVIVQQEGTPDQVCCANTPCDMILRVFALSSSSRCMLDCNGSCGAVVAFENCLTLCPRTRSFGRSF